MKESVLVKILATAIFSAIGLIGFACSYKAEMQAVNASRTPEKIINAASEIAGYKNWTKVNREPQFMESKVAQMCAMPTQAQRDAESKNPHINKFITVYVNEIGKSEMLTKRFPKFPVGTVIVKEKLPAADSKEPELLTVMIKREKNYNAEVGDWEFLTFNGAGTETTARGKLQNCQTCHLVEVTTDYVSRKYLPQEFRQKLK